MDKVKGVILLSGNNMKRWLHSPRVGIVFLYILLWINMLFGGIRPFTMDKGVSVSIAGLSLLLDSSYTQSLLYVCVVLLFSDVPFMNRTTPYECIRSGKRVWFLAQLVYIAVTSAIVSFALFLMQIIVLLPRVDFTMSWGKVYRTLGMMGTLGNYEVLLTADNRIIEHYSALEATLLSGLLFALAACFIGNMMFMMSLLVNRMVAAYSGLVLAFLPALGAVFSLPKYTFYLPTSWSNLELLEQASGSQYPSIAYAFGVLIAMNVLISIIVMLMSGKRRIEVMLPV